MIICSPAAISIPTLLISSFIFSVNSVGNRMDGNCSRYTVLITNKLPIRFFLIKYSEIGFDIFIFLAN